MVFGSQRDCDQQAVGNFIRQFNTVYTTHGGSVENKNPPILYATHGVPIEQNVNELYTRAGNQMKERPQLLVFILRQKSTHPYNQIKAFCDTKLGVVSQCKCCNS